MRTPVHPMIEQFVKIDDPRRRAAMLLAMPDSVILDNAAALSFACQQCGLRDAAILVNLRLAALHVVRSSEGLLPDWLAHDLDIYRAALARFAAGPSGYAGEAGHEKAPARDPPAGRAKLNI